jgi:hypothetical protein
MYQVLIMAVQLGIFHAVEGLINNPSKCAIISLAKYNKNCPHILTHTSLGIRRSSSERTAG